MQEQATQEQEKPIAIAPNKLEQEAKKNEIKDTSITSAVASLEGYGFLVDSEKPLAMAQIDARGARAITLSDKAMQVSASIVQTALKAGRALDSIVCVQMAKLKRNSVHADAGYESFGKFGEALTAWNKDTVNAYTSIGETYFNEAGSPVKPYVLELSVSALNQLKGLVNAKIYVYKAVAVNHDFLQAVFEHFDYNITVGAIKEFSKILKSGVVPENWVTVTTPTEESEDKTVKYTLLDSDIELTGYKPVPESNADTAGDKSDKSDKGDKVDKKQDVGEQKPVDPLELMSDALVAMQKLTLSSDLAKRFELAKKAMQELILDIEQANKKPTQEQEQATQESEEK